MNEQQALEMIEKTIIRCEKFVPKFKEGTSQHSLLKNRIQALQIAQSLLQHQNNNYSKNDLEKAHAPLASIVHKTSKARSKYEEDSKQYRRFTPTIEAMELALSHIEREMKQYE